MELIFTIGGGLRKVFINGRIISFLSAETGYTPLKIDLDKLEQPEMKPKLKKMKADKKFLKELASLQTEEEMARDVIKDFQENGWRLVKKNG